MVREVIECCCQAKEDEDGKKEFAATIGSLVILIRVVFLFFRFVFIYF